MNNFEKIKAMARIGGKGMTRERDRIQENANKYIVKNCPAIYGDEYCKENTYEDGSIHCIDCTDCVIKQVIQECRKSIKCFESNEIVCPVCSDAASAELAQDILQLFDIEEINNK